MYEENDQEIYDSFFDSGHPSEGDWDTLVWYLDVEIASGAGGSGSLTMKDHAGASPLTAHGALERLRKERLGPFLRILVIIH